VHSHNKEYESGITSKPQNLQQCLHIPVTYLRMGKGTKEV